MINQVVARIERDDFAVGAVAKRGSLRRSRGRFVDREQRFFHCRTVAGHAEQLTGIVERHRRELIPEVADAGVGHRPGVHRRQQAAGCPADFCDRVYGLGRDSRSNPRNAATGRERTLRPTS